MSESNAFHTIYRLNTSKWNGKFYLGNWASSSTGTLCLRVAGRYRAYFGVGSPYGSYQPAITEFNRENWYSVQYQIKGSYLYLNISQYLGKTFIRIIRTKLQAIENLWKLFQEVLRVHHNDAQPAAVLSISGLSYLNGCITTTWEDNSGKLNTSRQHYYIRQSFWCK